MPDTPISGAKRSLSEDGPRAVFSILFGMYLIAHHFYLFGNAKVVWLAILPLAFALIVWPRSGLLLLAAVFAHLVQTLLILPIGSNHLIISLFLTVGFAAALVHTLVWRRPRRLDANAIFEVAAPLGRWLLIFMYFYGVFHKLNTDFLNPETSCAVWFWNRYGFPEAISSLALVQYATIYGTLIVETLAVIMLLTRRFRWIGIILGIGFHGFLGLVPPGQIRAYSLLAIALHSLFLPRDAFARFAESGLARRTAPLWATAPRRIAVGLAATGVYLISPFPTGWIVIVLAALGFVAIYGRESAGGGERAPAVRLVSPALTVNLLILAFVVNGFLPYLGFKTGQAIAMFSNLVTEGGRSNHVLMPNLELFGHQRRIVTIRETDIPELAMLRDKGFQFVEFQVLDMLERYPDIRVTFEIDGEVFTHEPGAPLPGLENLPPSWLRKLVIFRPVMPTLPRHCDAY